MGKLIGRLIFISFLIFELGGCASESGDSQDVSTGNLKLMVSAKHTSSRRTSSNKATVDQILSSVNIIIHGVHVRSADDHRYYAFQIDPFELDLMNIDSSLSELLGRASVAPGEYDRIRLMTAESGSAVRSSDGVAISLTVPSGSQSGIKIKLNSPITVGNGGLTIVVLNFDLDKSLVLTPGGNHPPTHVKLKPVIKVKKTHPLHHGEVNGCWEPKKKRPKHHKKFKKHHAHHKKKNKSKNHDDDSSSDDSSSDDGSSDDASDDGSSDDASDDGSSDDGSSDDGSSDDGSSDDSSSDDDSNTCDPSDNDGWDNGDAPPRTDENPDGGSETPTTDKNPDGGSDTPPPADEAPIDNSDIPLDEEDIFDVSFPTAIGI